MASADVFKDLHARAVKIENNNSASTNIPNLRIQNLGSGDALITISGGAVSYAMGVDNSSSDIFQIRTGANLNAGSAGGLTFSSDGTIASGGVHETNGLFTLTSTNSVFYPPRMTSAQMEAINAAPSGAIVFNTTSGAHYVVSGAAGIWGAMYPAR